MDEIKRDRNALKRDASFMGITPEMEARLNHVSGSASPRMKKAGRWIAFLLVAIAAVVIAMGLSGCTVEDDDGPDTDWYMSGVWQNDEYWDENMVFYTDGTGYWESVSTGEYLDFDYYCYGDGIYFTFYPPMAPAYELDCYIDFIDDGHMRIVWPPDSFYGPETIYYSRIG